MIVNTAQTTITGPTTVTGTLNTTGVLTASAGLTVTGGITSDQITPPLNGSLALNGNNTNTKIVLGTGTVAVTGNTSITGTLTSSGLVTANAGLTVAGNVSMPSYMWAAGVVNSIGVKQSSTGMNVFSSGGSNGTYSITWTPVHPLGNLYIVVITGRGVIATLQNSSPAPTATTFQVQCYAPGTSTLTAGGFNFMVLAS